MIVDTLKTAGEIANGMAKELKGPAQVVAQIAGIALNAGAIFAAAGEDPVVRIHRLLNADPELAKVEEHWASLLNKKFGP